jgi:NAD(P)-dependent dehydrogenase (short-subunit alcohol dehydrogenase family)
MEDFQAKVAVVTGGGSGIGRATGRLLAEQGMKVVLADVNHARLDEAGAADRDASLEVTGIHTDVADFDSMARLAAATYDLYGAVHVLYLNAGIGGGGSLFDSVTADWERVIGVNLKGVIWGIKAFVPRMVEGGDDGYVLATSSGAGTDGTAYQTAGYSATKAGVLSVMEALYGQLKERGSTLKVGVVFPPLTASNLAGDRQTMVMVESDLRSRRVPATLVEPEEVAAMVLDGLRRERFFVWAGRPESKAIYAGKITEEFFEWNETIIRGRAEAQLADGRPDAYIW